MSFKEWMDNQNSPLMIAHVGWEGNIWDQGMQSISYNWLIKNEYIKSDKIGKNQKDDYINLHSGRDFLKENGKYDLVILYHIFNPSNSYISQTQHVTLKDAGPFAISDRHNIDEWRKRLIETDADVIFAHGNNSGTGHPTEIVGRSLGNLPGYHREDFSGYTMYMNLK